LDRGVARVSTQPDDGLNTPENLAAQIAWLEGVAAKKRESTQPISDDRDVIREAIELVASEDFRLNGCACNPMAPCYFHAKTLPAALAALVAVRHELEGVKMQRDAFHIAAGLREEERDKAEAALVAVRADNETLRRTVTNLEQAFAAAREDLAAVSSPGEEPETEAGGRQKPPVDNREHAARIVELIDHALLGISSRWHREHRMYP
jgi:hypothetical protein